MEYKINYLNLIFVCFATTELNETIMFIVATTNRMESKIGKYLQNDELVTQFPI